MVVSDVALDNRPQSFMVRSQHRCTTKHDMCRGAQELTFVVKTNKSGRDTTLIHSSRIRQENQKPKKARAPTQNNVSMLSPPVFPADNFVDPVHHDDPMDGTTATDTVPSQKRGKVCCAVHHTQAV